MPEKLVRHVGARLSPQWRKALLAATLLSVLLAAVAAIHRIPWSDEGLFSSASYNLAHHGFMGTTVVDPTDMRLTRIDLRTYWVMPLYLLGQAVWLKLFPATLVVVRLFTVLWIPLVLFSFYRFLRKVTSNPNASALATCLLGLSFIFIDNAGFARPDLMCFALGLSGLAVYVEWREEHFYRALIVSNALIAASGLTHPNGVFHLLGLVVLVLYYDRRRLSIPAVGAAALPYAIFAAIWSVYIFQDYSAFHDQMRGNGTNGRWASTLNPIAILSGEFRERYMLAFGLATRGWALLKLPAAFVYLIAIAGALFQRGFRSEPSTRLILLLAAIYFVALAVFNQKLTYYLVHILPWYLALTALYVAWLWQRIPKLRIALVLAMAGLTCLETGGVLLKAFSRSHILAEEQAAIDFARAHAQPQDRIVATAGLIYGFGFDTRLHDDERLGTTSGLRPDVIVIEPLYRGLYESWTVDRPREMAIVSERLATYRRSFDNGTCQVYLRPERANQL